jgi:hypothetical protein
LGCISLNQRDGGDEARGEENVKNTSEFHYCGISVEVILIIDFKEEICFLKSSLHGEEDPDVRRLC